MIAIKINLYVKLKFKDPVIYVLFLLFLYVLLRVIYVYNIYFLLFYFLLSSFLISVAAVELAFKNTRAEIFTTNVCFGRLLTTENTAYFPLFYFLLPSFWVSVAVKLAFKNTRAATTRQSADLLSRSVCNICMCVTIIASIFDDINRQNGTSVGGEQRGWSRWCSIDTTDLVGSRSRRRRSVSIACFCVSRDLLFLRPNGFPLKWPRARISPWLLVSAGRNNLSNETNVPGREHRVRPTLNPRLESWATKEDRYEFLRDTRTSISVSERDRTRFLVFLMETRVHLWMEILLPTFWRIFKSPSVQKSARKTERRPLNFFTYY